MVERVVPFDVGVVWEPSIEHGVLTVQEDGDARLALEPRSDDPNRSAIVIVWQQAWLARMEPPNDEAIAGHRLYAFGLGDVHWVGEVLDSSLIAELEQRNSVHSRHDPAKYATLRHWIAPLKGSVVEVIAMACNAHRVEGARPLHGTR